MRSWLFLVVKVNAQIVFKITSDRDDFLLRLNNYKPLKEIMELKLLQQKVIVKVMTASVMQLRKNVCSL